MRANLPGTPEAGQAALTHPSLHLRRPGEQDVVLQVDVQVHLPLQLIQAMEQRAEGVARRAGRWWLN